MTRTDPPNPTPDARPPLTDAEHQALTEHLTTVTSAARIAVIALTDGRAVLGPRFPGLLADLGSEIAAAQRIVHGDDDTAALAVAGVLAPTDDDRITCAAAYVGHGDDTDVDPEGIGAALDVFAARLAARLPQLSPAATCGHDDITGNRCEGCGAPVVIERALSLAELTGGTPAPAQIDGPTAAETAKLVALWDKLPDISRTAIVTSLLTMFVAHRNGSDALSAFGPAHGLPVVGLDAVTGALDSAECDKPGCSCRTVSQ